MDHFSIVIDNCPYHQHGYPGLRGRLRVASGTRVPIAIIREDGLHLLAHLGAVPRFIGLVDGKHTN